MITTIAILYILGAAWTYAVMPLVKPISARGITTFRIVSSVLWPITALIFGIIGILLAGFK